MANYDFLIIGGGIAGTTAAETLRKENSDASIAIVSDEPYRLYSRIMLSKPPFFLEKVPFDKIWMKTEEWYAEKKIDFLKGLKATELDADSKIVKLDDGSELGYGKLLLAVGACARPMPPAIKGSDKAGIYVLRTLDEGKAIMEAKKNAKSAVLIGGGFISFELADLLKQSGLEVAMIIREPHYWDPVLDETAGNMIGEAIEKGGVKIYYNMEVQEVLGGDHVETVLLKDGSKLDCGMICCGIGVFCPIDWLKAAGLETEHGILANEYLQTNLPDVWTAGDIAEYKDLILNETVIMANWANAQMQGKHAALNMLGQKQAFESITSYSTHGFGTNIGFIGNVHISEDKRIITRGSKDEGYARIIISGNEIVGATLINRNQELVAIKKLIEENVDVSESLEKLGDAEFDLKELVDKK